MLKVSIALIANILFFLLPNSSVASCSGLKGCNTCYDSLLGAEKEDVICQTDDQCIAIPHRCGDFYFLNKDRIKNYIDKNLKPDQMKKAPAVECKVHRGWQAKVCQAIK